MVKISYQLENKGSTSCSIEVQVLLDIMLAGDDKGEISLGEELLFGEREWNKQELDKLEHWEVKGSLNNGEAMYAYGKLDTKSNPDKILFANWDKLYMEDRAYVVREAEMITDSAVAYVWGDRVVASKDTAFFDVYYGVKNESLNQNTGGGGEPSTEPSTGGEPSTEGESNTGGPNTGGTPNTGGPNTGASQDQMNGRVGAGDNTKLLLYGSIMILMLLVIYTIRRRAAKGKGGPS